MTDFLTDRLDLDSGTRFSLNSELFRNLVSYTVAAVMLWSASMYLVENNKFHWICSIPALFMTAVVSTYFFYAPEGFNLDYGISLALGAVIWLAVLAWFVRQLIKHRTVGGYKDLDVKVG